MFANNILFSVADSSARLYAAEINIKDLTDSLYRTCNIIDEIGASLKGNKKDCCITGGTTANYGDRDKYICLPRRVAKLVGIDTAATCPVCPSGIL